MSSLPTLNVPKYETVIPSTGQKIQYRPYLVKEEKILYIAQETNDPKAIADAVTEIIKNCTFNKVAVSTLTSFDIEYLFLRLRAKSVGETSTVRVPCVSCGTHNDITISLDEVKVLGVQEALQKKTVMISDTIGVQLRFINAKDIAALDAKTSPLDLIALCIESVFDADKVYPVSETKPEDLTAFIESMNKSQMEKIEDFIKATPRLRHPIKFNCVKCAAHTDRNLEGLESFFS